MEREPSRRNDNPTGSRRRPMLLIVLAVCCASGVTALSQGPPPDPARAELPLAELPLGPAAQAAEDTTEAAEACAAVQGLLAEGELRAAVTELEALLDVHGPSYDALYLLAQVKLGLGRFGEALAAAEHAVLCRPGAADAHYLLGRLHRQRGRNADAIESLRRATLAAEREPDNPRVSAAWYELGECLAEGGYLLAATEALGAFDRAVWELHPQHHSADAVAAILAAHPHGAVEQRLALLERLGRTEERVRVARVAAETRADDPYLSRLYVETLLEAGQPGQALEYCRTRLDATKPDQKPGSDAATTGDSVGYALLGLAIEAARVGGELDTWVAQLAESVSHEQDAKLATRLARRLGQAGETEQATRLWEALYQARPDSAEAAWGLADVRRQSGDLAGALRSLSEYVRANAERVEFSAEHLTGWMDRFDADSDFLGPINELSRQDDCDFATYTVLGAAAAAGGQTELAEQLLRAALEDRPGFALANVVWGRMLLTAYRWEAAREQAERALVARPEFAAAHFLLGRAHAGLDALTEAETAYKAALEQRPDEVEYLLGLARHYRYAGDLLGAQRYFQRAWSQDRTSGEAIEELTDSYLGAGKLEMARAALQEAAGADIPADVLRRIQTTVEHAQHPFNDEHMAALERQFADHPADARTGITLAVGLRLHRRLDEAREVLERVLAGLRGTSAAQRLAGDQALNLLARVQRHRLENGQAIAILEKLAERYPRRLATLRLLAGTQLADFRVADARATWERVLGLELDDAERVQARDQLLRTYVDFREFDPALALVEQWIEQEPENDGWKRAQLRVLLAAERGEEALRLATARLGETTTVFQRSAERFAELAERARSDPNDVETEVALKKLEQEVDERLAALHESRSEYVHVGMETAEYGAVQQQVRGWLTDQPGQPELQAALIDALLAGDQLDAALEAVGDVRMQTSGDLLRVLAWRARCYAGRGELERAVNELTSLLQEEFIRREAGARTHVREQLIMLLISEEAHEQALEICDEWLADVAEGDGLTRYETLVLKRFVLLAADREDEAIPITEALLVMTPYDDGLNNDLGYTWVERGEQVERALRMIKIAVAAQPLNAAFLDSLGWAYYKQGKHDDARKYLARAVRLIDGQDPLVYDHLGDVAFRQGDRQGAQAAWQRALELLEQQDVAERLARDTALLAALRTKLTALEDNQTPAVAPIAAEQPSEVAP